MLENARKLFPVTGIIGMGQMAPYTVICTSHYLYFIWDALIVVAHSVDSFVTY